MSVRARTTLVATLLVGIAIVLAGVGLVAAQRAALVRNLDEVADLRAGGVAALVADGDVPASLGAASDDDEFVRIATDAGEIVGETEGFRDAWMHVPPPPTDDATVHTVDGFRVTALRAAPDAMVYVASNLEPVDEAIGTLRRSILLGSPLLLALLALVTWLLVGRALRPVDAISAEVADISERSLDRRVPVPAGDDEIARLARTMNTMLDRLQRAATAQRRFVGDASHELQTPIAALRADLETAPPSPSRDDMLATTLRMERLVHDLLFLARSDDAPPRPPAPVDLDDVVLEEVARSRGDVDTVGVSAAEVVGRRDDLARVVGNLLDNALRHRRTVVRVALRADDDAVVLTVTDDGPGVAPEDRTRIFERFTRADDARARTAGGTGLGLSIASEIVAAHGGTIHVEDAAPGARFVVRLPVAE